MKMRGIRTGERTVVAAVLLGASCVASCLAAEEAAQPVYDHYVEYRWEPVVVKTTNADNEVRNQFDFTLPMHGPYLTNPGFDAMTVCWITRVPCAAGIEYREAGGVNTNYTRLWQTVYGQADFSQDMHHFHLKGLKPGTAYEYRLLCASDKYVAYDQQTFVGRETYTFRTFDPAKKAFKVWFTADFHGGARLNLDPMLDKSHADDADFYVYLGDTVEDNMNDPRYFITYGFIDDITRRYGKSKPSIFVRGNHDMWGRLAYQYGQYFPRTDEKTYYAFSQGNVLFIVLDSMWTGGAPANAEVCDAYRQEQVEWLARLKKTDEYRKAQFRVVMAHVGTHGGEGEAHMSRAFKEVLNDSSKEGRIHVMLVGHEHKYMRIDALSKDTKVTAIGKRLKPLTGDFNYTLVVGDLCESMIMDVEPGKLSFTSYKWRDGTIRDAFSIAPSGTVTDNMKVEVFPPLPPETAPVRKAAR